MNIQRSQISLSVGSAIALMAGLVLASGSHLLLGELLLTIGLAGLVLLISGRTGNRRAVLLQFAVLAACFWLQALQVVTLDGPVASGVTGGCMLLVALVASGPRRPAS